MSARSARKPKASKTPTAKPDRETIPLAALSITVTPPSYFTTTKSEPVTFEGEALAAALRWIALNCPNVPFFTDPQRVGFELIGVAEQCRAIGDADLEVIPADSNALFCSLADRLKDLAYRIAAGDKHYRKLEDESVTITRKPAAEVASLSDEQDAARKVAAYDTAQRIVDAVKAGKGKVA